MTAKDEARIPINSYCDVVTARQQGRVLAQQAGFKESDLATISTIISAVAYNIIEHTGSGIIVLSVYNEGGRHGLTVVALDKGAGIQDISLAIQEGYFTGKAQEAGLPRARKVIDEFEIISEPGTGTTVNIKKWS